MGLTTSYSNLYGEVYITDGELAGLAAWLGPEKPLVSSPGMIRVGVLLTPFKAGLGGLRRFMNCANHIERYHKQDVPQRHWYLFGLGVDPPKQGQGIGSSLIQPILSRADTEGLTCYLETMKAENVRFYQKHGFEVIVNDHIPEGGPEFWTMRREPKR